jgi:hypothetical protein
MNAFGFVRTEAETPSGVEPIALWGSTRFSLPEGTQQTPVRLQAEDYGASQGILYRRGGEKTAVVFNHPRAGFPSPYLAPFLLEGRIRRLRRDDQKLQKRHELISRVLIADIAAQIGYLLKMGFEKVVLLGNRRADLYHQQND